MRHGRILRAIAGATVVHAGLRAARGLAPPTDRGRAVGLARPLINPPDPPSLLMRESTGGCAEPQQCDDASPPSPHAPPPAAATRRAALRRLVAALPVASSISVAALPVAAAAPVAALASSDAGVGTGGTAIVENGVVRVPLEYIPALRAYVVHYYLFGERFGAVVDTGSPFLTAPATCSARSYKYRWGCYRPELTRDSGYADTYVALDNNLGTVAWRKAGFSFDPKAGEGDRDLVFGVFGPDLLDGPGGVFLGLIRETDARIYPSFLGQTGYESFCVDLRHGGGGGGPGGCGPGDRGSPELVLSTEPLIRDEGDYVPLVRDLNRRYHASVVHYAAKAAAVYVNGNPLPLTASKPAYVIFDSGCSGMSVSEDLYDDRSVRARRNREKSLWGDVVVAFATRDGGEVRLTATKPLTTAVDNRTLSRYRGPIIVLGLAFLDGLAMTVDAREGRVRFSR